MLGKVTFINSLILISIGHSIEERTHSLCSQNHCYFWDGITTYYEELQSCPEQYFDLEIYDETVQTDILILIFLKLMDRKSRTRFADICVPLNLSCSNSTTCTWKRTNQKATYLNWDKDIEWNKIHEIYYLRFNTKTWKTSDQTANVTYAKLCMRRNTKIDQTTEFTIETIYEKRPPFVSLFYLTIGGVVLFTVLFTFAITIFAIRKKRNSRSDNPLPSAVENIEEVLNENSNYAHLNRADRPTSDLYQSLRHYENIKLYNLYIN